MKNEMHALDLAAHGGDEDCAFNFGRECDCQEPERLENRIKSAGLVLIPADEYAWLLKVLGASESVVNHQHVKYRDADARKQGWWTAFGRLESVLEERP